MIQNRNNLITFISPNGWYALAYPKTWEVEIDEGCATFYKKFGGDGSLQISAYETNAPQSSKDVLLEYLADEGIKAEIKSNVNNKQQIAGCSYKESDSFTKLWFVTREKYLLFITYTSDSSSNYNEEKDVNSILQSIQITV